MKIYIGSDHAGYELKESLKTYLIELEYDIEDCGAFKFDPNDDYPDFVTPVAHSVAENTDSKGIILGGSGQGEAMAVNRVSGIRAIEYYGGNLSIVKVSREHNDANVLSLGARFMTDQEAKDAIRLFLETPFSHEDRHIRRINKF